MDSKLLERIISDVIEKLHMLPDEAEGMSDMGGEHGEPDGDEDGGKVGIEAVKVMKGDHDGDEMSDDSGDDDAASMLMKKKMMMQGK